MALEQLDDNYYRLEPAPFDVHAHPRVFDAITADGFVSVNKGQEGKAGLKVYTETALRSGIAGIAAMPNEAIRLYDLESPEHTVVQQFPIATLDRVRAMQAAISHEAVIPTAIYFGLDPETSFLDARQTRLDDEKLAGLFAAVSDECIGLKVYLAETTGGNNIGVEHGAEVARLWHEQNPEKPIIFHVEGSDVNRLLREIFRLPDGKDPLIHIAHVSSRLEMEAILHVKDLGMNVTCEVTPHHLFLDETTRQEIGGYGCMKPSLKPQEDVDFLWANMKDIDIFASDCAPHRRSDKEAGNPAFGITNHALMLPLLLGAVAEGRLTMDDIYQKFCIKPRQRFNLPLADGSHVGLGTTFGHSVERYEAIPYGFSPFSRLQRRFHLLGEVVVAQAGSSKYSPSLESDEMIPSYAHLIRPRNLGLTAVRATGD